jgi:phage-related minor tail protein
VIASPISFPLGGGRTGIAGEAGPEAIMPLARGADGRLGVRTSGGGASGPVNVTVNISTPDAESFRRSEGQIAAMLSRTVSRGQRNL